VPSSLPPPVVAEAAASDPKGQNCLSGVGDDGDGTFLLGYHADGFGPGVRKYVFFQIQGGTAVRVGGTVLGGEDQGHLVFSQPSGFSAFSSFGDFGNSVLETWSHDGLFQSRTEIAPFVAQDSSHAPSSAVGIDPSGGTAAVKTVFSNDKGFVTTYQRFDKNGVAETGEVQVDNSGHHVRAVGVALSGHALILSLVASGTWEGRWVARDGSPLSKAFTLQGPALPRLQFLVDGSLALGSVTSFNDPQPSSFQSRIEDGAEVAGPLPPWLLERSGNIFFAVRQGRAYASWGGGGHCGSDVEVLANSGKSCGCIKVLELSRSASVGRDGSLIVPHQNVAVCAYDLYPKLLR
jgi:hypothetical protein